MGESELRITFVLCNKFNYWVKNEKLRVLGPYQCVIHPLY